MKIKYEFFNKNTEKEKMDINKRAIKDQRFIFINRIQVILLNLIIFLNIIPSILSNKRKDTTKLRLLANNPYINAVYKGKGTI